ncbi:MAG: hypothetical protein ACRDG4_15815 [Chloroflexota bacterium]
MSTQPLHRVVRDLLAQVVTAGPPAMLDEPFSPAGFRLRIQRIRVRGTDELLAPFPVRAPASVTHHLYSSSISCPGLPEEDVAAVRAEIETTIFRYLNPLTQAQGLSHTVWLLSETEQQQATRVLSLRPEDEIAFIFRAGQNAQWTGPVRGLHKTMATLAQLLSRHSDFATGKLLCRPPAGFLFLGDRKSLERAPETGIGTDGRAEPTRGVFAIDQASYMDALIQLGEEEARDLAVAEFTLNGQCLRAHGPLGIPIYRIPHLIPASAIRSIAVVAGNEVVYEAPGAATD